MRLKKQQIALAVLLAGLGLATTSEAANSFHYRVSANGVRATEPTVPGQPAPAEPEQPAEPQQPAEPAPPPAPTGPFGFTSCLATESIGPTAAQCDAVYAGTDLAGRVSVSGGIQLFTVPSSGVYTVTLAGAAGGSTSSHRGGNGAILTTTMALTEGTVLQILVGQAGTGRDSPAAGGGGGTFIASGSTPLAVAGGGGAGGNSGGAGYNASTTTTLTSSRGSGLGWGGGGASFSVNGVEGNGKIAQSFTNGGTGGAPADRGHGGFGGGGAGGTNGGGGGGGYGPGQQGGAGGTSYSAGPLISGVASNTGNGYVTITKN